MPMVGAILDHVLIGTWGDIQDEHYRKASQNAIANLQARVSMLERQPSHLEGPVESRTVNVLTHLLKDLKSPDFQEQLRFPAKKKERLEEVVTNFIDCLNDPSQASLTPELEEAIEKLAISEGTLDRVDRVGNRIVVEIKDLEIGKWFFPLHFLSDQAKIPELYTEPFIELLDPTDRLGYEKSICINAKSRQFSLTAYPKPVVLGSLKTGTPTQLDEILIDDQLSSSPFEYWPNGQKGAKFIVESKLSDHLQLVFREKGGMASPILCLRMTYRD